MKRVEIMLGGLNCANCAAKINDKVNAKEEIDSARLSMVSKIMVANIKDSCDYNKVIDDIIYIIDDTEPGLDISVLKMRDLKTGQNILSEDRMSTEDSIDSCG